jgi:LDH2 family malate/lactate/ureidoglycolate dehydrogenase
MPLQAFGARLQVYLEAFKREPGIMAAGGPEWAQRREREVQGIPLPDGLYAELHEAAQAAGIDFGL